MTDRELLEMAAKAAGIPLDYSIRPDGKAFYHSDRNALAMADGGWFSPLTDDGDALRLAVKLRIDLHTSPIGGAPVIVTAKQRMRSDLLRQPNPTQAAEDYLPDPYAATRRAIVRAAAEIGRAIPSP